MMVQIAQPKLVLKFLFVAAVLAGGGAALQGLRRGLRADPIVDLPDNGGEAIAGGSEAEDDGYAHTRGDKEPGGGGGDDDDDDDDDEEEKEEEGEEEEEEGDDPVPPVLMKGAAAHRRKTPPARQDFAEHFHTLECGHRPSQALNSADRISAPVN